MRYAEVIVDISAPNLNKTFTYAIPDELDGITPGTPVYVPFGSADKLKKGYVMGITHVRPAGDFKIKNISSVPERELAIEDELMALAVKISRNYGGMLKDALRTVIPVKRKIDENRSKAKEAFPELKKLREEFPEGDGRTIELNNDQKAACDKIKADMAGGINKTYLLFGVTGSGKTEVYIETIRDVIARGKQVIVLIPEISLTFQTVERFARAFGNRVEFSHSKLSAGERYFRSEKAKNGETDIMIGPRSALFTPFKNLGLIIIDEEHESSYRSETAPSYNAREVARWRAQMCGASLILGSATPSLESYRRAEKGEYELLRLDTRAGGAALPKCRIVDMREQLKEGNRTPISYPLGELMADRLNKGEQIMLFLNRRGYAGFMSCRKCGYVPKCPHCDISLTYHKNKTLNCHYCGHSEPAPVLCPSCGSKYIATFGSGTQKIEQIVEKAFPGARTARMDADTTAKKGEFEKILSDFKKHKTDILIGTQMIVKGHDFPKVTLVGIIAADLSLYANDYMAAERTYELLAQAAGRAGRGDVPGDVIIQTYNPDHYCVTCAAEGNYEEFYEREILTRELLAYPPEGNILAVSSSSKNEACCEKGMQTMHALVLNYMEKTGEKFRVLGPVNASVYKKEDIFTKKMFIKSKQYDRLVGLKDGLENYMIKNNFNISSVRFDFNP